MTSKIVRSALIAAAQVAALTVKQMAGQMTTSKDTSGTPQIGAGEVYRRDDTGRVTSDYTPSPQAIEIVKGAISREFGVSGTDGYYIRILKAIYATMSPPTTATGGDAFTLDQIVDVLHCCDDEALRIVNRIAQPHGLPSQCPDGVQVLDDAETIIRAAFRVLGSSPGVQSAWKTFAASPKSEPATTGDQTPEREALERAASDFKRLHDGAPNAWVKQQALHAHNRCKAVLGGDA